jgi:hypothetical protein
MSGLITIPPMTHELSSGWRQPRLEDILVDEHCAVMTQRTADQLYQYDTSWPTAIYAGKMWKRQEDELLLCWVQPNPDNPHSCLIYLVPILILT